MLATSTAFAIVNMKFYILQIPSAAGEEEVPVRRLEEYNIALDWLSRLNVSAFIAWKTLLSNSIPISPGY